MPIFRLPDELIFPPPDYAEKDGLLAVGGDLSEDRILLAYSLGIFPWYSEDSPILWWSPDPRLTLIPEELKISRSLKQTINKGIYEITFDSAFDEVIRNCAEVHKKKHGGTWITEEMIDAYINLHKSGFAHSIESRIDGELAGGLYGVSLGGVFFGESMFSKRPDASKAAFVRLVQQLEKWDFKLIDCQVTTGHLMSFGAREMPRSEFISLLKRALEMPTKKGKWILPINPEDI